MVVISPTAPGGSNGAPPTSQGNQGGPPQFAQGNTTGATQGDAGLQALPAVPKRRTHISQVVIDMLKALSLPVKLMKNKEIEGKNATKQLGRLDHMLDPTAFPDLPSEDASFITIDSRERKDLRDPVFASHVKGVMPTYLAKELLDEEALEKKKRDNDPSSSEQREGKRRCMDGSDIQPRSYDAPPTILFHSILFTTENNDSALPLNFFLNENLKRFMVRYASLPTGKANLKPGATTRDVILDVDKLKKELGDEIDMTFSQWLEAAENNIEFQSQRDKNGKEGKYATFWNNHFVFFMNQPDRETEYDNWKLVERELRDEFIHRRVAYDAACATRGPLIEDQDILPILPPRRVDGPPDFLEVAGPFSRASEERPPLPAASSAPKEVMASSSTKKTLLSKLTSLATSQFGQKLGKTGNLSPPTTVKSASASTFEETVSIPATTKAPLINISAHSVATNPTTPFPGLAENHKLDLDESTVEDFLAIATPPILSYTDYRNNIVHRPQHPHYLLDMGFPSCRFGRDLDFQDEMDEYRWMEPFERIQTPYDAESFHAALRIHNLIGAYPILASNLQCGFPLGDLPPITKTVIFPNNPFIAEHMGAIQDYINGELDAMRMSGPYSQEEVECILCGPFHASPFVVSVHTQEPGIPDKIRVCGNLSKESKQHPSVNSYIRRGNFPTRFDTASRVADMISYTPVSTLCCSFDIAKFHRTCPVAPDHKPWLVVQGKPGEFFIDHVHPFGAACASSNAGMIANAAVDILVAEGIKPIAKFEDDLLVFCYPSVDGAFQVGDYKYAYDKEEVFSRSQHLGIPWHQEKGDPFFSHETIYVGFWWSIKQKRVGLPDKKRLKFLRRVDILLEKLDGHPNQPLTLHEVESIHGSLCHVAFVYLDGRSHLPSLSNFAASFSKDRPCATRFPPPSVVTDLRWWRIRLAAPAESRSLKPLGPPRELGIYVDASTSWGIGIVLGDEWLAFKLKPGWKDPGNRDICWLETLAVELLAYLLEERGIQNCRPIIRSDNQGTIGAFAKGRSSNFWINFSIRRAHLVFSFNSLSPFLIYVASEANLADPISRREEGLPGNRIISKFKLPDELKNVFYAVNET
ncbi:hypothetical protein NLJ89_g4706 [Agrocybe chaxingu]|uniref:Uncharacterized protein n=1 Tax=Agrocybe chaxingu TaxID=84603 RepID=A0A9W8MVP7_9AGAR|nr:hypothetical protein NLJ89_g4706 [Agrocybe chaxingu]